MSAIEVAPSSPTPLPELAGFARPRWRPDVPALWRDATTIQLGDDVIVTRVSRAHIAWLSLMDGLRTTSDLACVMTLPAAEARRLVRSLIAAGGLEDAARIPDAVRWSPQADRDGAARRFGAALRTYRDLDTAYDAMDARERVRVAVLGSGTIAAEVAAAIGTAGLRVTGDASLATIAVLADGHHPDVPAHFDHDVQDLPHVHVAALGARAVAGPLVVPGRTSCLRCAHLHLRDADPAWPLLAVQWSQAVSALPTPPIDPVLVRAAATHAVLLVRAWADSPDDPAGWGNGAVELSLPEGRALWVPRPTHPLCGCRWPTC